MRTLIRWSCLVLALLAHSAQAQTPPTPQRAADTLANRVLACTACHGKQGRATPDGYFPRIAGKPAGYLHNQLRHFQAGRRQAVGMASLLDHLDDAYLGAIAAYFASLELPYPPPAEAQGTPAQRARGEQLVRVGDASRGLPACSSCHGERMTGVKPAIPGLLGLPRDYLVGQLGGWQNGLRHASAPDCMRDIARKLDGADVSAVASWLAAQPVPTDAKPADRLPAPLPLACGSDLGGVR
ncbi:MAG: cytochrome c4 [Hydrogenophaga sp.]|uniref:c-type cytochrome n=1 Tax=Hydrogenophaga sp. TaxID=1904254 RepID=UPI001D408C67|nr:cytochrome c4 [Hydrogenophaga sp.]MBX3608298.1 cytochrome c4 [Hydrogenophaga sp.]